MTHRLDTVALIAVVLIAGITAGCKRHDASVSSDQTVGSGHLVTQDRQTGAFTGIRVTTAARVTLTQSAAPSLHIEADDNIIDKIQTTVSNGVLSISLPDGGYRSITINVTASMKDIQLLEVTGVADIQATGPIQTNALTCSIPGTGSITLAGTATQQTCTVSGVGHIRNFDLVSSVCSATMSGTGSIEVQAIQQLDATITGAGSIYYKGNPPTVNKTVTGVGSVLAR